jgi:hypothetical protein
LGGGAGVEEEVGLGLRLAPDLGPLHLHLAPTRPPPLLPLIRILKRKMSISRNREMLRRRSLTTMGVREMSWLGERGSTSAMTWREGEERGGGWGVPTSSTSS